MRAKILWWVFPLFLACAPWGRHGSAEEPRTAEELYARARAAMTQGNYFQAAEWLKRLMYRFPSSPRVEEAQVLLIQADMKARLLEDALAEAEFYLQNYPQGRWYWEVKLWKARILFRLSPAADLDQAQTLEARKLLQSYLLSCPDARLREQARDLLRQVEEKLAHRRWLEAEVYRNLGRTRAESLYLSLLIQDFPGTSWEKRARERLQELQDSPQQP